MSLGCYFISCRSSMFQRALYQYLSTFSTNTSSAGSRIRRLILFDTEWKRQLETNSFNLEKAIVTVIGHAGEQRQLLMNNRTSTFYDCLKHISRHKAESSALLFTESGSDANFLPVHSRVNGNSTVHFLNFSDYDHADEVNKAYWRSCAFLLGAIAETSFRANVTLKGALPSVVESGRFGYAATIDDLQDWKPSKNELGVLTRTGLRNYVDANLPFIPLTVDRQLAAEIFEDSPQKRDFILQGDSADVMVYKMGDHVDITDGPLIANTRQIGRFAVTDVEQKSGTFYFYGVSIPSSQKCSSFSWDLLVDASRQQRASFTESGDFVKTGVCT